MSMPTAVCKRDHYPAAHDSGSRLLTDIKYVVWHDTEGGTASSVAAMFQGASYQGSATLVVDDSECQRCLPDNVIPWAAPSFNSNGVHIEQCGFAAWSKLTWLKHQVMLHRTAYKTARFCKLYHIPVRFCGKARLLAGEPGITTHAEVTAYNEAKGLPTGGAHTDPGPNYPRRYVMGLTRVYRAAMH